MSRSLHILAPTRYPWTFNGPRRSIHCISRRYFVPFNRLWERIEGITLFNPLPPRRFDLIHAFNRIPLSVGSTPFIIGFESHLPRAFGLEGSAYWRAMVRRLAGGNCRAIIAISDFARRTFLSMHDGCPELEALVQKLELRYPNLEISNAPDALAEDPLTEIRVAFIGSHFGRKGGCVAVKLAELAKRAGFPLKVEIVSKLEAGGGIWTDPIDRTFFQPYFDLLQLPNVTLHHGLPNAEVIRLLDRSHFSLLTTFSDTFGYSVLESMSRSTPVIATRQGALPELVVDGETGILLDLPTKQSGDWIYSRAPGRDSKTFETIFADEVQRLAEESFARLVELFNDTFRLRAMRAAARRECQRRFGAEDASRYWDQLYLDVVRGGATNRMRSIEAERVVA